MKTSITATVAISFVLGTGIARADIGYLAPQQSNQIGFAPCCGYEPGGSITGPFSVGNTITLAGSGSPHVASVDLFGYAGGGTLPIEVDLYAGANPNTGTLLGSATAAPGYGYTTEVLNFGGLAVPQTLTFIVSVVGNSGSYDDSFVDWQQFTGNFGAPTIGTSGNMWYGAPGSYLVDNTYAVNTGAATNTLAAQFNLPEPSVACELFTMLAALAGFGGVLKRRLL